MRMLLGMVLRSSEIMTLAKATTAVTDTAMTRAGSSFAVTARAEQIPNICTITGLFLESGPKSISLFFFDNMAYIFFELSDSKNWA